MHTSSRKREPRAAVEDLAEGTSSKSRLSSVGQVILSPFSRVKHDSNKMLADLAPVIMTPRMASATANAASRRAIGGSGMGSSRMDFATLGRAPLRLGLGTRRLTSRDLQIVEATDELLEEEIPEPDGVASDVSLLRGFDATIPSSEKARARRRQTRNVETPRLGLKKLGMGSRGLLVDDEEHDHESVASEDDMVLVGSSTGKSQKGKTKRKGRTSLRAGVSLDKDELVRQTHEIERDKENLHVRRALINNEITEITHKIEALDAIRLKLEQDLLKLQEDELELDDELEGVKERLNMECSSEIPQHAPATTQSSRRRKGPAFLPSEHDELPHGMAFMTLEGHNTPITALDFSEPYGTLVSASLDDSQPRVWDLLTGEEIGRLSGHRSTVKCIQVEDHLCLTGGEDGNVTLWDLRKVDEDEDWERDVSLSDVAEEDEEGVDEFGNVRRVDVGTTNGVLRQGGSSADSTSERDGPCIRVLEGHSKAVTSLYFEDDCLVTGASDKTMRQWDLATGQCVMTMDILWAISHPPAAAPGTGIPNHLFPGAAAAAGTFAVPTPPYSDGSWDMYQDFVGGVQFWGCALVSGSGDGAVRMWDIRTGQSHRTLLGHTGPVTCVQFDELHVVSGSLDKSIRIWDLRTGGIFETLKYDHAVTALQFDTRKIVAATGQNGIDIYNRTTMQHSTLLTNGHTRPAERMRYMDKYLVSGGRDAMVKIWAL